MAHLTTMTARVGRKSFPVKSWQQVSEAYRKTIEALNLGAAHAPACTILDDTGNVYGHSTYEAPFNGNQDHGIQTCPTVPSR